MATEGATDAFWYSPGPARSRSLKTKRTRRHLKHHGIEPESCPAFKIVACGSLFPGDSQHPVPGCNGVPEHWRYGRRYGHREAPARPRHRCRPRPKRRRESHVSDSNTNAHSEGGGITSRQILRGPDEDSLAVLLNDIHRDAQGFVARRVEPEIS